MPAPPILETYVLWHPDEAFGSKSTDWFIEHFHGPAYAGLAGGSRRGLPAQHGWGEPNGPPRSLPLMDAQGGVSTLPQRQVRHLSPSSHGVTVSCDACSEVLEAPARGVPDRRVLDADGTQRR